MYQETHYLIRSVIQYLTHLRDQKYNVSFITFLLYKKAMANAMLRQPCQYDQLLNFHFYFTQNKPVLSNYIYQFYYNCPSSQIKLPSIYNWGKTSRLTYTTFKENDNCHVFGLIEFFHTHRLKTVIKRATFDIPQIEFFGQSEPYFKMVPKLKALNSNGFHRFSVNPENQKPKWQRVNAKTRNPKKTSKEVMKRQEARMRKIDPTWIDITNDAVECAPHLPRKVPNSKPIKTGRDTIEKSAVESSRKSIPRTAKTVAQQKMNDIYTDQEETVLIPFEPHEKLNSVEELDDMDFLEGVFDDNEYLPEELVNDSGIWV